MKNQEKPSEKVEKTPEELFPFPLFGERIRRILHSLDITQEEVESTAHMGSTTLCDLLKGKTFKYSTSSAFSMPSATSWAKRKRIV